MWKEKLYAVDENGKTYYFERKKLGNSLFLTLKKEQLQAVKQLRALGELSKATAGETGYYILPRSPRMSGEVQTFFIPREDGIHLFGNPLMSWYGIKKKDLCALIRVERNHLYQMEASVRDGVYIASVFFDFEACPLCEDLRIEIIELPLDADYNDMAKAERKIRAERGELRTLEEKCRAPQVEYARKHPLVRIRMGWKPSPSPEPFQTEENEPEMYVACDFARVREIADEMKRQGVEGVELQLVGWNRSGHDGRYPQLFPADPRLGGDEGFRQTIEYVKKLGYRISTHTNRQDAYTIADTFDWEDIVITKEGERFQKGQWGGGNCFRICPAKQLKNAKRDLPALAAYRENGIHYTDVTSVILPDICYSEDHPSTLSDGIRHIQTLMEYIRGLFGAFSSEGCFDFSLKELDFGLYACFGTIGAEQTPLCDRCLPLFEVAYHGYVLYNPVATTVNFTAQSPADRLILLLRGGKPAMYFHSKFRSNGKDWMGADDLTCIEDEAMRWSVARVKKAEEIYKPFADLQTVMMDRYDHLEDGVERATYENGTRVYGNFSDRTVTCDGITLEPWGYRIVK